MSFIVSLSSAIVYSTFLYNHKFSYTFTVVQWKQERKKEEEEEKWGGGAELEGEKQKEEEW